MLQQFNILYVYIYICYSNLTYCMYIYVLQQFNILYDVYIYIYVTAI